MQQPPAPGRPMHGASPGGPRTGAPPYGAPPYGAPPYGGGPPAYPYPPPYAPRATEPSAVTAMVLGILGLAVCGVVAPFAWSLGNKSLQNIRAHPGMYEGEGMARAGFVMGIVGTVMLILTVVFFIFWFAMVGAAFQSLAR